MALLLDEPLRSRPVLAQNETVLLQIVVARETLLERAWQQG